MTILGLDPSLTGFGVSDGAASFVIATTNDDTLGKRCRIIFDRLTEFATAQAKPQLWVVEAPMLNPKMGMHLYEVGWIMSHVYDALATVGEVRIIEVPPATLKKFVTTKGNADKTAMAIRVYKRWGVEFPSDRGGNLVDAYCLHKYGVAVEAGEIEHVPSAKRGAKRKKAA